jgi:Protein of unknown function (DUF3365)
MSVSRALVGLSLLGLSLVGVGCSSPGSGASGAPSASASAAASKEDVALAAAKAAAAKLGTGVRTKLMDAMNNGGPANAVQVCSAEAQGIAEQVAKETGASVGRSSLKLRNVKDAPPGWVQTWLVAQGDKKVDQTQGIEGVFDAPVGRVARVLKPIAIDGVCLSCHGDPEQISAPVKEVLAAKYPDDKATGYKAGDLRGALWAEVRVGK